MAQLFILDCQRVQQAEQRLGGGQVDLAAALAGPGALLCYRSGNRKRAEQAGNHVPHRVVHMHRPALRGARQVGEAAPGFKDAGKARSRRIGPGLAEAGQPQHDQLRVGRVQRVEIQPPARQRAGAEVLDQHIELRQQAQEDLAPARRAHVERDAALAAVGHLPVQGVVLGNRLQPAQRIAAVGQFQLDHIGAHVGTQRGGKRAGHHGGHVEDAQSAQRARAVCVWRYSVCVLVLHGGAPAALASAARWQAAGPDASTVSLCGTVVLQH
ncbi:hypothetical protein D9M72_294830 [compost metagenome]